MGFKSRQGTNVASIPVFGLGRPLFSEWCELHLVFRRTPTKQQASQIVASGPVPIVFEEISRQDRRIGFFSGDRIQPLIAKQYPRRKDDCSKETLAGYPVAAESKNLAFHDEVFRWLVDVHQEHPIEFGTILYGRALKTGERLPAYKPSREELQNLLAAAETAPTTYGPLIGHLGTICGKTLAKKLSLRLRDQVEPGVLALHALDSGLLGVLKDELDQKGSACSHKWRLVAQRLIERATEGEQAAPELLQLVIDRVPDAFCFKAKTNVRNRGYALLCGLLALSPATKSRDKRLRMLFEAGMRSHVGSNVASERLGDVFRDLPASKLPSGLQEWLSPGGFLLWALRENNTEILNSAPSSALEADACKLLAQQDFAGSMALFDVAVLRPDVSRACYANALCSILNDNHGLGVQRERGPVYLAKCLPHAKENPTIFVNAACLYMELGNAQEALASLQQAVAHGYSNVRYFLKEPTFVPLHGDPIFEQILETGGAATESNGMGEQRNVATARPSDKLDPFNRYQMMDDLWISQYAKGTIDVGFACTAQLFFKGASNDAPLASNELVQSAQALRAHSRVQMAHARSSNGRLRLSKTIGTKIPVVPQEFIAETDTVVTLGEMSGTYKATGKSFKTPFVHVWKFSADRLQSFTAHMDTLVYQRALE